MWFWRFKATKAGEYNDELTVNFAPIGSKVVLTLTKFTFKKKGI